jgi:hypothetical protein
MVINGQISDIFMTEIKLRCIAEGEESAVAVTIKSPIRH